jgi:hypothetical protein
MSRVPTVLMPDLTTGTLVIKPQAERTLGSGPVEVKLGQVKPHAYAYIKAAL